MTSETQCSKGVVAAKCQGPMAGKRPAGGKPLKYEIINMSDPYFMTCPDLWIAKVACVVLGEGNYGLRDVATGETVLPPMPFGFGDQWMVKEFGNADGFKQFLLDNEAAIGEALATVQLPKGRQRSSLNDIGKHAQVLANAFTESAKNRAQTAPEKG